jgi:hypothetical protein
MHVAERNLWRAISKILWAFDIQPITDPVTGKPKLPNTAAFSVDGKEPGFAGGAVRVAFPFEISIKPRSGKHASVIEREYIEALPILERYN